MIDRIVSTGIVLAVLAGCASAAVPTSTSTTPASAGPVRAPTSVTATASSTSATASPASSGPGPTVAATPTAGPAATSVASPSVTPEPSPSGTEVWSLVAVGDSIPYNAPGDCPGCASFVDRYATKISKATGHAVKVKNLSQHNSLRTADLLDELTGDQLRRDALASADIIVVSIGHNDLAWSGGSDPCGVFAGATADWAKADAACAATSAEAFRARFEEVFSEIAAMRVGKPTILRAINTYNDAVRATTATSPAAAWTATRLGLDAWNATLCKAATASGFVCADIYHAFNGPDGLTPSGDLLGADYTHPSDKGNAKIADVLAALGYAPLVEASNPAGPPVAIGTADVKHALKPGTYNMREAFVVPFTLTLPSEYTLAAVTRSDVQFNYTQNGGYDGAPWLILDHVGSVYLDPCHTGRGPVTPQDPTTVDGLMTALTNMVGFTAGPVSDVDVGGHHAKHFELTNDIDTDAAGCSGGGLLAMYTFSGSTAGSGTNGRATEHIWIVDVGGTPVLIDGETFSITPEEAIPEIEQIVRSITFE